MSDGEYDDHTRPFHGVYAHARLLEVALLRPYQPEVTLRHVHPGDDCAGNISLYEGATPAEVAAAWQLHGWKMLDEEDGPFGGYFGAGGGKGDPCAQLSEHACEFVLPKTAS